ncbi:unnamed protein product [Oikopleura dioica]|uniref:Uncharacterized protein n=1 Tax=Oikopleura dioica TaxID=34765 RepID=E4XV81_OIKDI|nr:unnamed protein product [Oikopleura dioica]
MAKQARLDSDSDEDKENVPNNAAMVQFIDNQSSNQAENFDPNKPGPSYQCLQAGPLKKTARKPPIKRKKSANKPKSLRRHVLQKGLKTRSKLDSKID